MILKTYFLNRASLLKYGSEKSQKKRAGSSFVISYISSNQVLRFIVPDIFASVLFGFVHINL